VKEQLVTVRISAEEKAELDELAYQAGQAGHKVSLSDAFRFGARLYLLAVAAEPTRRGPKPKNTTSEEGGRRLAA
jgi:hypothetical protein